MSYSFQTANEVISNEELYNRIILLNNSFEKKINEEQHITCENNDNIRKKSSILDKANKQKIVLNKKDLYKYDNYVKQRNFIKQLKNNDFTQCFYSNTSQNQCESLKGLLANNTCDSISNIASKEKKDLYNEYTNLSKEWITFTNNQINSFSTPISLSNNPTILMENSSYDLSTLSCLPLPKYSYIKPSISIKSNDHQDFFSLIVNQLESQQNLTENRNSMESNSNDDLNKSIEKALKHETTSNEIFKCKLCIKEFTSAQGLGGHMSRVHKNRSEKYKLKQKTRESYKSRRELREEAKKQLCMKYNHDYDALILSKKGKAGIKRLLMIYKKEFKGIRESLKLKK